MIKILELLNEEISFKCELDTSFIVSICNKEDAQYKVYKPYFKKHGYAFCDINNKHIFIDGEAIKKKNLTKDHLLFIQAHEIGHIKLKHGNTYNKIEEAEADYYAIKILQKKNKKKAMNIGLDNFESRHNMKFPIEDLK
ncbi:MAG: M48 family metalloprotease [Actinobacteria bacterium]|nr:M48 family metalloprotease [Actinomycetota bacterium]